MALALTHWMLGAVGVYGWTLDQLLSEIILVTLAVWIMQKGPTAVFLILLSPGPFPFLALFQRSGRLSGCQFPYTWYSGCGDFPAHLHGSMSEDPWGWKISIAGSHHWPCWIFGTFRRADRKLLWNQLAQGHHVSNSPADSLWVQKCVLKHRKKFEKAKVGNKSWANLKARDWTGEVSWRAPFSTRMKLHSCRGSISVHSFLLSPSLVTIRYPISYPPSTPWYPWHSLTLVRWWRLDDSLNLIDIGWYWHLLGRSRMRSSRW